MPNDYEPMAGLIELDLATGRAKDAAARVDGYLARNKPPIQFILLAGRTWTPPPAIWTRPKKLLQQAIAVDPSRLQAYAVLGQAVHLAEPAARSRNEVS